MLRNPNLGTWRSLVGRRQSRDFLLSTHCRRVRTVLNTWSLMALTTQGCRYPSIHLAIPLLGFVFLADIFSPLAHIDMLSSLADSASAAQEEQTQ